MKNTYASLQNSKLHINFASLFGRNVNFYQKSCSNGGMVDTKDLKSFGYCSCAGSSPASSTKSPPNFFGGFFVLKNN